MAEVLFDATKPTKAGDPSPTRTVVNGVSSTAAARIAADELAVKAAGFAPAAPLFAVGTLVNSTGHGNYNASRQDFEALPLARDALFALVKRVRGEGRTDRLVKANALKLLSDGSLTRGGPPLPLTVRAFDSLCGLVTPGGARYLRECPPDLRATNVNHWLQKADGDRELTIRARRVNGDPEAYAIVGPRYTPYDVDRVAQEIADALPADARADVVYDGFRFKVTILWHATVEAGDVAAGEFFKAGIIVRAGDDGSISIQIDSAIWRNLCLNLIIVDCATQQHMRRRHVGNATSIGNAIQAGMTDALQAMKFFREQWGYAKRIDVLDVHGVEARDVFQSWLDDELVVAPGGKDVVLDRLLTAWHKEPGSQATHFVNAVTRAAHEATWATPWVADDLQRQAGKLLATVDAWDLKPSDSK